MTYVYDPRLLQSMAGVLRPLAPDIEIVVLIFFRLDIIEQNTLQATERKGLHVGGKHLRQFVRHWREIGVSRLVYLPTETPSVDQLSMLADAVLS